jgi:hypothetical protein
LGFVALIAPIFIYRHYIQDKGRFPDVMAEDLGLDSGAATSKRAGIWPYVVLVAGVLVVVLTHAIAVY